MNGYAGLGFRLIREVIEGTEFTIKLSSGGHRGRLGLLIFLVVLLGLLSLPLSSRALRRLRLRF